MRRSAAGGRWRCIAWLHLSGKALRPSAIGLPGPCQGECLAMISLAYGVLSSCSKSSHASRSARHQATASHVPVDRARVHGSALSYPSATPATLLRGYSVWLPHLPEGPLDGRVVTATREGVTRRPAGPRARRRRSKRRAAGGGCSQVRAGGYRLVAYDHDVNFSIGLTFQLARRN